MTSLSLSELNHVVAEPLLLPLLLLLLPLVYAKCDDAVAVAAASTANFSLLVVMVEEQSVK